MIIYADVLIITNFIINYFLFRITQIFSSSLYNKNRLILSSFIGAIFSLIVVFDIDSFFLSLIIKIIAVSLSVFIAFGFQNYYYYLKNLFSLLLANFTLYGLLGLIKDNNVIFLENTIIYLNINPILLVVCVLIVFLVINIFNILYCEKLSDEDIKIKIKMDKEEITLNAFHDTGFKIRDIINNNSVMLIEFDSLKPILQKEKQESIERFFEKNEDKRDFILTPIFYSTINGEGILPSFKAESIAIIHKEKIKEVKNCLVAVSNEKISNEKKVIIGKEIYKLLSK